MAVEIERKFLVRDDSWRADVYRRTTMRQGFLAAEAARTVRVRDSDEGALVTIKGRTRDASRAEFEYSIPRADAGWLLDHLCLPSLIEKTRHCLQHDGHTWEIDVFFGVNDGLVVAEIELSDADEAFTLPAWAGREVTDDPRYYNARLSGEPYNSWPAAHAG